MGQPPRGTVLTKRLDPDVAVEAMRAAGVEPLEPYPGSSKKWHCRCLTCGREVWPRHTSVHRGQGGCRYCAAVKRGKTQTLDARRAIQEMRAVGLEPLEAYRASKDRWRCLCRTCGQEVVTSHSSVKQGHDGCRRCAMAVSALRRRRSNAAHAVLLMQGAGLEPLEEYPGTTQMWRCLCLGCGREVSPTHDHVKQSGRGCKHCSLKTRGLEHRIDPEEAASLMRAAGLEPLEPYPTIHTSWLCRCRSCHRKVDPSLNSVKRGARCRFCSGTAVDPDEAVEVMRTAGVEPLEPYPGANAPWLCECLTCGRHPRPRYGGVRQGRGACGYCAGKLVDASEAIEIMRDSGFRPLVAYPGSLDPWRSECLKCGRESTPRFASVKAQGTRCAYCQGARVDPTEAAEFMRGAGLDPLEPYPGASTPWSCRCLKCGRTVRPVIGTIRAGGGCKFCATRGLDFDAPALLYLVTHDEFQAHKVGIGSPNGRRLATHHRYGWRTYRVMYFETGHEAYEIESATLRWLRLELRLPPALTMREMPQMGFTETVYSSDISLEELWFGVRQVMAEHRSQGRFLSQPNVKSSTASSDNAP